MSKPSSASSIFRFLVGGLSTLKSVKEHKIQTNSQVTLTGFAIQLVVKAERATDNEIT